MVQGNKVGTDAASQAAVSSFGGIRVTGADNVVGGVAANAENVVSGNQFYGITLDAPAARQPRAGEPGRRAGRRRARAPERR